MHKQNAINLKNKELYLNKSNDNKNNINKKYNLKRNSHIKFENFSKQSNNPIIKYDYFN